jgi:hypothetical protein
MPDAPRPYNLPSRHEADWPTLVGLAVFIGLAAIGVGTVGWWILRALGVE